MGCRVQILRLRGFKESLSLSLCVCVFGWYFWAFHPVSFTFADFRGWAFRPRSKRSSHPAFRKVRSDSMTMTLM